MVSPLPFFPHLILAILDFIWLRFELVVQNPSWWVVFTCFNPKIWVISTIPPHIYLYIRLVCLKNKNYMWTPKQSPNSARPHRPHRPHAHIVAPTVAAALGMAARHAGHESLVSVFHRCPVWLKKLKIKATRLGFKCDSCDILWLYWGFHSGYKKWDWIWFWYMIYSKQARLGYNRSH